MAMIDNNENETIEDESFEYDMRPQAGILNVFSRLNYKPYYAIAEFVDNSTQSYFLHSEALEESSNDYEMTIEVNFDSEKRQLTIQDNAFGMERDRFLDAITLDAKNDEQVNSRNEYGMGLKTAASWFGNEWTVRSTALGSDREYSATVNIPHLHDAGANNVKVEVHNASVTAHGTLITIKDVTKGMGSRAIGKTKSMLASMYRRDLKDGKIHLYFNGAPIVFNEYDVLSFRDREWKKPLDFVVKFDGKEFRVHGFVGILASGGFGKAGFALFRRGRVVLGGEEQNYKPQQIFGQPQSPISHKLFGELDVDDFPVNQAKDGFVWDDGLEDAFINALRSNIRDFIDIAKMTNKERAKEEQFSDDASDRVAVRVKESLLSAELDEDVDKDSLDLVFPSEEGKTIFDETQDPEELKQLLTAEMDLENSQPEILVGKPRSYSVRVSDISTKAITVSWSIADSNQWITVVSGDDCIDVQININHPFFKPYSNEEEFQIVLEQFVIAFVVAEEQAKMMTSSKGLIPADAIRLKMNKFLSKLR